MEENKAKRTDVEIAKDFEQLFDEIPEPETNEEVTAYLIEAGYDPEVLKAHGTEFVANLIANNWRFISSEETDKATARIKGDKSRSAHKSCWDKNLPKEKWVYPEDAS